MKGKETFYAFLKANETKKDLPSLPSTEADREAKAKIKAAEGEQKAATALKEASNIIAESPSALQLRYLQTLHKISEEKNSTIIFPLPMDMFSAFKKE